MLGIESEREVLTFIDGDVANDPSWEPGMDIASSPMRRPKWRGAARQS